VGGALNALRSLSLAARQESEDPTATALIEFLRAEGAGRMPHGGGRPLLEHLVEAYRVTRRWGQPAWLQHAALLHSVYGTEAYRRQLLPFSRREELRRLAGEQAERIAYLFSVTPRGPLLAGSYTWLRSPPSGAPAEHADEPAPTRAELDALVMLHLANLAEQARSEDGSPATWLVRLRDIADSLIDSDTIVLPTFLAELAAATEEDELFSRRSYLAGLSPAGDMPSRESALGLASAVCPVLPEPCVWLAHFARLRSDDRAARAWAGVAGKRLQALGTVWDKRLSFDEWLSLATALGEADDPHRAAPTDAIDDPRWLFEATFARGSGPVVATTEQRAPEPPNARFLRYLESVGDGGTAVLGRRYPDLESRPWYDAREFPLAVYLEENFEAIRREILALEPSRFHPESERIERSGNWDVVFFYERGRRREEVCEACPVTARGLDSYPAMRTITGLIYVSRMRAGTHIAPHRGPTNLRLRCHLGIQVPSGDCAIRVDDETRHWEAGRCLVFDDFFEHEAWNHTGEDRLVLIADLWHPGLSGTEMRLLERLHSYTYAQARKLGGYWAVNAAAARASMED
jgi:aspartate beta-hydroxylase